MSRLMDLDMTGLEFTRNWFLNRNLASFREFVYPEWVGKPICYLELGVFEGMSLCWMLQHVLVHPDAQAVGIDPWLMTEKLDNAQMTAVMERAIRNTNKCKGSCQLVRANSAEILRRMAFRGGFAEIGPESVDLCMVDGNHNSLGVLDDCRLVYRLLKPGGEMMLDDVENARPKDDHVKLGLQMFLTEIEDGVELMWEHGHMECYRKRKETVDE